MITDTTYSIENLNSKLKKATLSNWYEITDFSEMRERRNQIIRSWIESGVLDSSYPLFDGEIDESSVLSLSREIEVLLRKINRNHC